VIPLFHEQIKNGGPVTVTTAEMTRFLLPLERAVDTIIAAVEFAAPGETFVPRVPAARIADVATALIAERHLEVQYTGIRPGEKVHEIMVSDEEAWRTFCRGEYFAIKPMLPELATKSEEGAALNKEYCSADSLLTLEETKALLKRYNLMVEGELEEEGEVLR
jgi:UDP-glucose 4-epimerase